MKLFTIVKPSQEAIGHCLTSCLTKLQLTYMPDLANY
jgi:hypothetical protein